MERESGTYLKNKLSTNLSTDCNYCYLAEDEDLLMETEHFYVVPTIGAFVEGYILIITKEHIRSMGEIRESYIEEFENLKGRCRKMLVKIYGSCIFYEHGRAGTSVNHAHLHALPVEVDIFSILAKNFGTFIIMKTWNDLVGLAVDSPHYLYYENCAKNTQYFFPVENIESQFFRRVVAEKLMLGDFYDWREYPFFDKMRETAKRIREVCEP